MSIILKINVQVRIYCAKDLDRSRPTGTAIPVPKLLESQLYILNSYPCNFCKIRKILWIMINLI